MVLAPFARAFQFDRIPTFFFHRTILSKEAKKHGSSRCSRVHSMLFQCCWLYTRTRTTTTVNKAFRELDTTCIQHGYKCIQLGYFWIKQCFLSDTKASRTRSRPRASWIHRYIHVVTQMCDSVPQKRVTMCHNVLQSSENRVFSHGTNVWQYVTFNGYVNIRTNKRVTKTVWDSLFMSFSMHA